MKAVHVWWNDSATDLGWRDKDISGPSIIESVGWLVHETADFIVLSTSNGSSGKWLDQISIPRSAIRKVARVKVPS